MTEEEKKLIERYDITVTQKSLWTYKGYTYDRLENALNYARIDTDRQDKASEPSP